MQTASISYATQRNWERLGTNSTGKLTKRANKLKSKKRYIPYEYISNPQNIPLIEEILEIILSDSYNYQDCMFTLCVNQLIAHGIYEQENVQTLLGEYDSCNLVKELQKLGLPEDEHDFIGALYQSLMLEGNKNSMGSYYTPPKVICKMTCNLDFTRGQTFLDPCCGSGSFLLSLKCSDPSLLFGIDNDPIAVMIAKTNLVCKYSNTNFIPQIYCMDYLFCRSLLNANPISSKDFDYIYTNPPWGAITDKASIPFPITSGESFSSFFVRAFSQLKPNGQIRFLFPESILNVKVHKDIRQFILENCCLHSITFYTENFTGVVTSYVDILASKSPCQDKVCIFKNTQQYYVSVENFKQTGNMVFNILTEHDVSIIDKVKRASRYNLSESIWALGIVTGNNKEKLFSMHESDMEPIFTGKEISKYCLKPAQKYIRYDRSQFQQVAKDEIYRAEEKLVYKFISSKLVFAYDAAQRLFLNSANILIPNIPGMSVKTVMAFLNSRLYSYLYKKLFGEIKILKGNLLELPFPKISTEENREIENLVNQIMESNDSKLDEKLQNLIYGIFNLSNMEIDYLNSQSL